MKMKNKKNENENKESCDNLCNLVVRKRKMLKDERGQWIISAGFLVSVSIVILALLLNQAMMGGYQSSGAILEFPKHDIRELVQETHREVNIAADRAWKMNDGMNITAINLTFRNIMLNYTNSVEHLYASHGQKVYMNISSLSFDDTTNKTEKVNVTILFSDGVTTCTFEPELIEIPGIPEHIETLYAVNLTCDNCTINNETNAYNASNGSFATVVDVSNNGTVNATIGNHTVSGIMIGNATFQIRLNGTGWDNNVLNISYSPNNGSDWYPAESNVSVPTNLNWTGIYPASGVDTWAKVDNMTIRITGREGGEPDIGNLSIDAYHVYVEY